MKLRLEALDVVLNWTGRLRCDPGWRLDENWAHGLRDYDLWYVWAGRGRMLTSDGAIELYPGRGLWMRPGRRYEAEQDPQERLGVSFIHFRLKTMKRLLAVSEFTPPVEVFETRHPDYFNAALAYVARPPSRQVFTTETTLLFKALLLTLAGEAREDATLAGIERHHREAINRSLAYLQDNAAVTVGELAHHAGYSVDHFTRLFHQVIGQPPKDYIVRRRVERAMLLLRESSQTVGQIADALGYQDAGFFSRQFRQKVGVSPAHFRRQKTAGDDGKRPQF